MTVSIDKASAEDARVELNARMAIKCLVVLFKVDYLTTMTINGYKWLLIKPLWCQQVVGGYQSEC